jgi:hypothetical protein
MDYILVDIFRGYIYSYASGLVGLEWTIYSYIYSADIYTVMFQVQ